MRYYVALPGRDEIAVDVHALPDGSRRVAIDGTPVDVDLETIGSTLNLRIDGRIHELWAADDGPTVQFSAGTLRAHAKVQSERDRSRNAPSGQAGTNSGHVYAPMPGRIIKCLVAEGDAVEAGAPVIVIEAMKMENELRCEQAGTVKRILVTEGENVEGHTLLLEWA